MNEHNFPKEIFRSETLYLGKNISMALVALSGINRSIVNYGSTTDYNVFAGRGVMFVGYDMHILEPGTHVTVPVGTPYYDAGEDLVMWATSNPPFNERMVEEIR